MTHFGYPLLGLLMSLAGLGIAVTTSYVEWTISKDRLRRQWSAFSTFNQNRHPESHKLSNSKFFVELRQALASNHEPQVKTNIILFGSSFSAAIASTLFAGGTNSWSFALWVTSGTLATSLLRHYIHAFRARASLLRQMSIDIPTEIEKLSIYLGAGYSITGALQKLSSGASSATRELFQTLGYAMNTGIELEDALRELRQTYPIPSVTRLASVLESSSFGADLPRAVRNEANSQRVQLHRNALATMEKNSQKIWIPITIAALVPGIVLIFIPFISVMKSVTGS